MIRKLIMLRNHRLNVNGSFEKESESWFLSENRY